MLVMLDDRRLFISSACIFLLFLSPLTKSPIEGREMGGPPAEFKYSARTQRAHVSTPSLVRVKCGQKHSNRVTQWVPYIKKILF